MRSYVRQSSYRGGPAGAGLLVIGLALEAHARRRSLVGVLDWVLGNDQGI